MKVKNLVIIGVIALVVIGCIMSAGCTVTIYDQSKQTSASDSVTPSTTTPVAVDSVTPSTTTPVAVDTNIIGTWTGFEWDDGFLETKTLTINQDGTGVKKSEKGMGSIKIEPFTWTGCAPVFQLIFENGTEWDTYTLVNNTLIHDDTVYTKGTKENQVTQTLQNNTNQKIPSSPVSIVGTWKASEWDDGFLETKTLTINQDGTGTYLKEDKGEIKQKSFIWTNLTNGRYLFTFGDGDTDIFVYYDGMLLHDDDRYTKK